MSHNYYASKTVAKCYHRDMENSHDLEMRMVIVVTILVALGLAIAPWLNGGGEPLAMVVTGFAVLLGTLLVWRQPAVRSFRVGPVVLSYGALVAFGAISLLWSVNRYATVVWLAQWIIAGLAFRLAYVVAGERSARNTLERIYIALACALGIYMVTAVTIGANLTGFFTSGFAGLYLAPALILGLEQLRLAKGRQVMAWVPLVALILSAVLVSANVVVLFALAGILAVYLLVVSTSRRFWISALCAIAAGGAVFALSAFLHTLSIQHTSPRSVGALLAANTTTGQSTVSSQLEAVESSVNIWRHNLIDGTGAGTVATAYPRYQTRDVGQSSDKSGTWLSLLAELGPVGAIAAAALVLAMVYGTLRGIVADPSAVATALSACLLLICFCLENGVAYPAVFALTATLFGAVYAQRGAARERVSALGPVLALIALVPLISLYLSDIAGLKASVAESNGDYETAVAFYASAHSGVVYNPAYLDDESSDLMVLGSGGGSGSASNLALALSRVKTGERIDPLDGEHYNLEGRIRELQGDTTGALSALKMALVVDPYNHPEYSDDLATLQWRSGNLQAALATAQSMIRIYSSPKSAVSAVPATVKANLADLDALIGNIYLSRGQIAASEAAAQAALQFDSQSLRGRALMHQVQRLESGQTATVAR